MVISFPGDFSGGSVEKNLPASVGHEGSVPGSERFSGEGNGTLSSIFAWRIPLTEEPSGLQSMGYRRVGQDSNKRKTTDFIPE